MAQAEHKDVPYAEFGKRLMELRKDAGLTRAQLGEKCGVAQSTIVNYERGTRIPYADTAAKMAVVFGMTVEDLLGVENPAIEQKKAEALDTLRTLYGPKGENQARALIDGADSLLAGGTLTYDQQQDFILEMQKLFIVATEKARAKFTPNKYRSEERDAESAERLKETDAINQQLSEKRAPNSFLDEEEFHD